VNENGKVARRSCRLKIAQRNSTENFHALRRCDKCICINLFNIIAEDAIATTKIAFLLNIRCVLHRYTYFVKLFYITYCLTCFIYFQFNYLFRLDLILFCCLQFLLFVLPCYGEIRVYQNTE